MHLMVSLLPSGLLPYSFLIAMNGHGMVMHNIYLSFLLELLCYIYNKTHRRCLRIPELDDNEILLYDKNIYFLNTGSQKRKKGNFFFPKHGYLFHPFRFPKQIDSPPFLPYDVSPFDHTIFDGLLIPFEFHTDQSMIVHEYFLPGN